MKIGLTGTVSVGKSTLVKELAKLPEFKDYFISTERSKYLRDLGIELNTDSTVKGQVIFMAERSSELFHKDLITDRSIWDVSAFTLSSKTISWDDKRKLVEANMIMSKEYDYVFYVSPEGVDIEDNGVRETDSKYRDQIDYTIRELLKEYPPNKLIKISGTTEQRIEQIKQSLV